MLDDKNTLLGICTADRQGYDVAMSAGDFELAEEMAINLASCAIGLGSEELQADAEELKRIATGGGVTYSQTPAFATASASETLFVSQLERSWSDNFGEYRKWNHPMQIAWDQISAARGKADFEYVACDAINQLRLSPETMPAFLVALSVMHTSGGEYSTAADFMQRSIDGGIVSESTKSFAYNFILGAPEETLLPLFAAGKLGKLAEGAVSIWGEGLGLASDAISASRITVALPTEAISFIGSGRGIALAKGKDVDLSLWALLSDAVTSTLVFGVLKFGGWFGQVAASYFPKSVTGQAAAYANAQVSSIGSLILVDAAGQMFGSDRSEEKSFFDIVFEAAIVHFGISAMMGSVNLDNLGRDLVAARNMATSAVSELVDIILAPTLVPFAASEGKGPTKGPNVIVVDFPKAAGEGRPEKLHNDTAVTHGRSELELQRRASAVKKGVVMTEAPTFPELSDLANYYLEQGNIAAAQAEFGNHIDAIITTLEMTNIIAELQPASKSRLFLPAIPACIESIELLAKLGIDPKVIEEISMRLVNSSRTLFFYGVVNDHQYKLTDHDVTFMKNLLRFAEGKIDENVYNLLAVDVERTITTYEIDDIRTSGINLITEAQHITKSGGDSAAVIGKLKVYRKRLVELRAKLDYDEISKKAIDIMIKGCDSWLNFFETRH